MMSPVHMNAPKQNFNIKNVLFIIIILVSHYIFAHTFHKLCFQGPLSHPQQPQFLQGL